VVENARRGVEEADAILFLVDVTSGVTGDDQAVARILQRSGKPVVLAVNKVEKEDQVPDTWDFVSLGCGDPLPVSALHGRGVGELLDRLTEGLPAVERTEEARPLKIALIGRPNVGKSSLLNALLGEERMLVHEEPGTTRDAIDVHLRWNDRPFVFVDTAGLKRRSRTRAGVPVLSALKTLETIGRSDVTLLLLDASRPVARQDVRVASHAHDEGKGILVCVNKWDLVEKDERTYLGYERTLRGAFPFLGYAPVLFISALDGTRLGRILPEVLRIREAREKRIPTPRLNEVLERAVARRPPPHHGGGTGKILYGAQVSIRPPTFAVFVNDPARFPKHYIRFLNNSIRDAFEFHGTVIRLSLRPRPRRAKAGTKP
jgi:GTP-binding protein